MLEDNDMIERTINELDVTYSVSGENKDDLAHIAEAAEFYLKIQAISDMELLEVSDMKNKNAKKTPVISTGDYRCFDVFYIEDYY